MSGSFNRVHAFDATAESDLLAPSQEASAAASLTAKVVNIETSSFFTGTTVQRSSASLPWAGQLPRLSENTESKHDEHSSPAILERQGTFFALEGLKTSVGLNHQDSGLSHQDSLQHPTSRGESPFRGSPEPASDGTTIDVPPVYVTAEFAKPGNATPATLIGSLVPPQDEHQAADTKASNAGSVKWGDRSKVAEFPIHKHIPAAEDFVLALEPQVLSTWGMLYCGGSKPVEQELLAISQKYKIEMSAETFAW